ncbi:MAG TPA: hypothetical protein VFR20_10730 [Burkholderiaceae bacterium]|nr:hypothetical protein [Burkholderiaceae bacterium]
MPSDTSATNPTQLRAKKPSSSFIAFSLLMAVFAFAAAITAFNPHIGVYLRTPHWSMDHLTLLLATLALASGISAVVGRRASRTLLAWSTSCAAWLLVVVVALLFLFRYPAEFYVQHNKNVVEDHVPEVLEEQALVFNHSSKRPLWGSRTTYGLTWLGPASACVAPALAQPGQCKLMECVVDRSHWLAGARIDHSWNVQPFSDADELRDVQCHEVDPAKIKPGDYDDQGRRSVPG